MWRSIALKLWACTLWWWQNGKTLEIGRKSGRDNSEQKEVIQGKRVNKNMAVWGTAWRGTQKRSCFMKAVGIQRQSSQLVPRWNHTWDKRGTEACGMDIQWVLQSRRLFLGYPLLQGGGFKDPECSLQCTPLIAGVPPYYLILDYAKDHIELPSQGFALSFPTPTEHCCNKALALDTPLSLTPPPSCSLTVKAGHRADRDSLLVSVYSHSWCRGKWQEFQPSSIPSDSATARSQRWTFSLQRSHSSKPEVNLVLELPFEMILAPRTHLCSVWESFNTLCWTQSSTWTEETL